MKKLALLLLLFISQNALSQFITVNTNTYTVPQLVNNILINSTCIGATNITWSTGTNFGSTNGIGYFQNTNPNFPMQSGVILSSGNVSLAPGPKTGIQSAGTAAWLGDTSLDTALAAAGVTMVSKNATYLEFDFVPISSHFDFDFLFASEEYGNFQCNFSDSFAFLLTNMSTGVTTNLAIVPGTTDPISVVTIRDNQYNTLCSSENPQFFGSFNGSSNAASSAINFNGQTKLMNASATLIPNVTYRIKLVIADGGNNPQYDSAIFLSANSFNIGQEVLGNDLTIANGAAICEGQTQVLNTGLSAAQYSFTWKKNGVIISGETSPSLSVTQAGTYEVTYVNNSSPCQTFSDPIVVEFLPTFTSTNPQNLRVCNTGQASYIYDLTKNTTTINLGVNPPFEISYHHTAADANNNVNPLPLNYSSPGNNETVYVRIKNPGGDCFLVKSFILSVVNQPTATQPNPYNVCSNDDTQTIGTFTLNSLNSEVLNGQSAGIYGVNYYPTLNDANAGTNQLLNSFTSTSTTIYVKVSVFGSPNCSAITTVNLIVNPRPPVDVLDKVITCSDYTLPVLTNGSYFSDPNGTGTQLLPGDIITNSQILFIYNGSSTLCPNSSQFEIVIIKPDDLDITAGTYCNSYILPPLQPGEGEYHTEPHGGGTVIPSGTEITTSQTVYFYFSSTDPIVCEIDPPGFVIDIVQSQTYDSLPNGFFDCTSYTLQPLPFGNYYSDINHTTIIPDGTPFTSSQTIYAYGFSGICPADKTINIVIGTASFPANQNACVSYTLPTLAAGNYYSDSGHTTIIPDGTEINTNQTIYVYAPSQNDSSCIDNYSFIVSIVLPPIVPPTITTGCGNYTLPAIAVGNYFTATGGTGTALFANDVISSTQTIYIYQKDNVSGCDNEIPLDITVNIPPNIDVRSDVDVCNATSYELPPLTIGEYHTVSNGGGTILPAGTIITTPQTIYIYAVDNTVNPPCPAEGSFKIDFLTIQADAPQDVERCDSYTLLPLNVGNYYTGQGGTGTLKHAGDVITNTITLYVYAVGVRATCTDEHPFTITINHTPIISPTPANIHACNSYFLPVLTVGDYYTATLKGGTMLHAGDEITTTQTVYIYAETNTTPNCWDEKSFTIDVYNVDELPSVTKCSSENFILPPLTIGKYYNGPNGTLGTISAGTTVSSTKTIYIFGHSGYTPDCTDQTSFTVTIIPAPIANPVTTAQTTVCDIDGTNDGITSFDLTQLDSTILGTQTGPEFSVKYYASNPDATTETNPITSTTSTTVFVRVNNTLTPDCYDIKPITIIVNRLPEPTPKDGIVCINSTTGALLNPYLIETNLPSGNYTYEWQDAQNNNIGSNSTYLATLPGNYSVTVTNNATGCISEKKTVVVNASEPAVVTYVQNDEFSSNSTITVIATGTSNNYEYQLDEGIYQDSPIFENVLSGIHTITVRDKNGCGITSAEVLVINYPKYFTPNDDGYNDRWNIFDLNRQASSTIFIYDRYGKLLIEISPSGKGWDGKYNGNLMPSDDYWFVLNYEKSGTSKSFRAHFTLKR